MRPNVRVQRLPKAVRWNARLGRELATGRLASEPACRELATLCDGQLRMSTAQRSEPAPTVAVECEPAVRWPPKDGQPEMTFAPWRWRRANTSPATGGRPCRLQRRTPSRCMTAVKCDGLCMARTAFENAQRLCSAAAEGSPLELGVGRQRYGSPDTAFERESPYVEDSVLFNTKP